MDSKYMMATTAIHKLGDISRDESNLCIVFEEDKDNYYGHWVEGFGFVGVKFPKSSTRDLTEEEIAKFDGKHLFINSTPAGRIQIRK